MKKMLYCQMQKCSIFDVNKGKKRSIFRGLWG